MATKIMAKSKAKKSKVRDDYWSGWNAAIEAVASVLEKCWMRSTAKAVVRPMKRK